MKMSSCQCGECQSERHQRDEPEIDEANYSHAQEVADADVLRLAKECGAEMLVEMKDRYWQKTGGATFQALELQDFVSKIRAKDAETIVQLREEIETLNSALDAKITICGDTEIASLKAQLAETQNVPDGWQLVPNVTSKEMRIAGQEILPSEIPGRADYAATVYHAMLAAAPTYKKED
jgi:hypothetical protein